MKRGEKIGEIVKTVGITSLLGAHVANAAICAYEGYNNLPISEANHAALLLATAGLNSCLIDTYLSEENRNRKCSYERLNLQDFIPYNLGNGFIFGFWGLMAYGAGQLTRNFL